MRRRAILAGAAALAGCSVLPAQPFLQTRNWPLDIRRGESLPPRPRGRVLLVRSVRAAPGLEARGVQWLQRDGSVHVDFYEQWAVAPALAVEDDLRRWLADAGLFSAVLAPGSRLTADYVVEGELTTFIADPNAGMANAALALVLLDQRAGATTVLLQKTVSAQVKLDGTDVPAIVTALQAALTGVLQQAETDVRAVVR